MAQCRTFEKRLKVLEEKVAKEGILYTEEQLAALERAHYRSVEQLLEDLNFYVFQYNEERMHQGKWCKGMIPMQTFLDSLQLAWIR